VVARIGADSIRPIGRAGRGDRRGDLAAPDAPRPRDTHRTTGPRAASTSSTRPANSSRRASRRRTRG